jgi:serine/threonine protein kinase
LDNIFGSIKFLVSNNKSHNDIKPDNMIYSRLDNKVKFIDLGSITSVKSISSSGVATTPMFASLPIIYIIG